MLKSWQGPIVHSVIQMRRFVKIRFLGGISLLCCLKGQESSTAVTSRCASSDGFSFFAIYYEWGCWKFKRKYIYLTCVQSMNSIHVSVLVWLIISCMYRKLMDWSTVAHTPIKYYVQIKMPISVRFFRYTFFRDLISQRMKGQYSWF